MDKTITETEELYEALIDLANQRAISEKIIHESANLLKGLNIIVERYNEKSILVDVIKVLREIVGCENIIIMVENSSHQLTTQVSTSDFFSDLQLDKKKFLERIIKGDISISFDILSIPEWKDAPKQFHNYVTSSIHIGLGFNERNTILICCDSRSNFFNRNHADLIKRYSPLVKQALINISAQEQIEVLNRNLLDSARQAGMADVAANVIHSIGNVLNSLAVSSELLKEKVHHINTDKLIKLTDMLRDKEKQNTKLMVEYLTLFTQEAEANKYDLLQEINSLISHIGNIKAVVALQEEISKPTNISSAIDISALIEDVLKDYADTITAHNIIVDNECKQTIVLTTDQFQLRRIISNLLQYSINDLITVDNIDKKIYISCDFDNNNHMLIKIKNNGMGIMPEDIDKIFNLGFSTEKNSFGYGLHYSAIAAKSLGGDLHAYSEGVGKGTEFILSLKSMDTNN